MTHPAKVAAPEQPLYAALDWVPEGICVLSSDFKVLFWNSCLEDWTGLGRAQIVGARIGDQFPRFAASRVKSRLETLFEGGPPALFSAQFHGQLIPMHLPDRRPRIHHTTARAIKAPEAAGHFNALLAIKDVTDLAETVRRYRNLTNRLHEVNAEMEAFSYSVSHDLRAPLRHMAAFADFLQSDYGTQLDTTGREYVQTIIGSARRMDGLIQDLLKHSRLSRQELRLQSLSLDQPIAEALQQLQPEIASTNAEFVVERPLPQISGDPLLLAVILNNLLANAIKFIADGTTPHVRIWAEDQDSDTIRLGIRDNGIGIAPDHQARIFNIFARLHTQEAYPGTGIGLAIVHKAITRMGGAITLESVPEQGSTFWLELAKPSRQSGSVPTPITH